MKKLRAIVVLLFSIALPYAATANMVADLQCHHDGLGALTADSGAQHHHDDHAATHDHASAHHAAADQGCDCAVKCQCQHHCAGGGAAALAFGSVGVDFSARDVTTVSAYLGLVSEAQSRSLFRPPITAPPGAA